MKRIILLLLVFYQLTTSAQLKYCVGPQEYGAGEWIELNVPIQVDHRSKEQKWWWGGSEFKFITEDKKTDKMLRNDAFVIMYQDSLYVNCKRLRSSETLGKRPFGTGYTKAFPISDGNLLVVYPPVSSGNAILGTSVLFGVVAGIAVAGAVSGDVLKNMVCYLVRTGSLSGDKNVKVLRVDTELMEKLLADDPDMLNEYKSVKKKKARESAANTLDIFTRKGWIQK